MQCPRCSSLRVEQSCLGQKTGATVGAVAGLIGGACSAFQASDSIAISGSPHLLSGPRGYVIGAAAGMVIGALVAGTAGCEAGMRLGKAVDEHILDNCHCLDCGCEFSVASVTSDPVWDWGRSSDADVDREAPSQPDWGSV